MGRPRAQEEKRAVIQNQENHTFVFIPQHERAIHSQGVNQISGQEDVCPISGRYGAQNRQYAIPPA